MAEIVNLTPHDVHVVSEDGSPLRTFPRAETPARLAQKTVRVGEVDGIPVTETVFGEPENLPEPEEGVHFIVSVIMAQALKGTRDDLLITAEAVRDEQGRIVGCRSLGRV